MAVLVRRARATLALLFCACLGSCYAADSGRLDRYLGWREPEGFLLTAGEEPPGTAPLALVSAQLNGWYLLALVPIVPVSLELGVEMLAAEARRIGADGVAHIQMLYQPPYAVRFSVFPVPDWSSSLFLSGMAFKRGRALGR
jgi:hypothetical protein